MKILIAGDLVPTEKNIERFKNNNFFESMDAKFQEMWENADFRMFNLECALGENMRPIDKNGPNLIAPSITINGIKSLNPDLIFLSNNHIKDYGIEGIDNTIKLLKENNINYTGIINNSKEKLETVYVEKDNIKVGIYNLCENEFSVATLETKGANPLNEIKNYKEIKELKEECDYVVVIFHGGKEYYRYPSPNLQRICRNFVDFGADVVITQHSHCIGALEEYNNCKIIYGQGNFIFDGGNDEFWNNALILGLTINNEKIELEYIPIEKHDSVIKISENNNILKEFFDRNEQIKNENFVEENYEQFARKNLNLYLKFMNKSSFYKKVLNRLFNRQFFVKIYNKAECLRILNIIQCEAHRELFIKGLEERIGEMKKSEKN